MLPHPALAGSGEKLNERADESAPASPGVRGGAGRGRERASAVRALSRRRLRRGRRRRRRRGRRRPRCSTGLRQTEPGRAGD